LLLKRAQVKVISGNLQNTSVGLIGCGTIGNFLARKIECWPQVNLAALADLVSSRAAGLVRRLSCSPQVLSPAELISCADLIIEAASADLVPEILPLILEQGKKIVVMSVGGLLRLEPEVWARLSTAGQIYIPSGALAGLDAARAACLGKLSSVTLTTRKPPPALAGAPYLEKKGIRLDQLSQPTLLFDGNAREAALGFPKNINVAAALSLATLGPEETRVRIVADPAIKVNIHQIELEGDFGRIVTSTENAPFPLNPKTSYLAALSALATATLKQILFPSPLSILP